MKNPKKAGQFLILVGIFIFVVTFFTEGPITLDLFTVADLLPGPAFVLIGLIFLFRKPKA